jgi:hypothetical protein
MHYVKPVVCRSVILDSYISKVAKAKKDKDRTEAEEELEIARDRL